MRRFGWRRRGASLLAGTACLVAGVPTVLSFNLLSEWHPLATLGVVESGTFFDVLDFLTSNVLLPASGLAIALFAGWVVPARVLASELGLGERGALALRIALRFVVPAGIVATAVSALMA
jgi:neurotransmitter:Na+ symporter, NSS family